MSLEFRNLLMARIALAVDSLLLPPEQSNEQRVELPATDVPGTFDALGRTTDGYIAAKLAEHADALRARNSTFAELFYFGDVEPPGKVGDYGHDQWALNTQSMHVHVKHNQAYVFARNSDGQWDANEAMLPQFGHTRTATFLTREDAYAHFDAFLARELGIDPDAPGNDLPFLPSDLDP